MGLFINDSEHPDVFKNKKPINEPNQQMIKKDYFAELMQIHQESNASLSKSLEELKRHYQKQNEIQSLQLNELYEQLKGLKNTNLEHKNFEVEMLKWLQSVEEKNEKFQTYMEEEAAIKQKIHRQIQLQMEANREVTDQMQEYETANQYLSSQLEEQVSLQKELAAIQENFQEQVLTRLDNQEAITEKLSRQIHHMRSILFERTNFLAEKIENGYKQTSSFVHKLIMGSDTPLTFYMFKNKKEENPKKSD